MLQVHNDMDNTNSMICNHRDSSALSIIIPRYSISLVVDNMLLKFIIFTIDK
jgi:hypothetical protein